MIHPFKGLRYDAARAGACEDLVSQPYDKISPAAKAEYEAKSAYNVVRLIRGEAAPGDTTWYDRAAGLMREWMEDGILVHEDHPVYYLYEQSFVSPADGRRRTRRGVVGAFDLARRGSVLHHERTHSGAREDRRRLLDATGVHFGQIFILRHDGPRLDASCLADAAPLATVVDADGTEHAFSRIDQPEKVAALGEAYGASQWVIADGHHRFTVAGEWADAAADRGPGVGRCLVVSVEIDDEGLVVLPTHRVLRGLPRERVGGLGPLMQRIGGRPFPTTSDLDPLVEALREAGPGTIAAVVRGGAFLLPLPGAGTGDDVEALDVRRVEANLVEPLLRGLAVEEHLIYRRDPVAAARDVLGGEADCAFLLNPIAPRVVAEVARKGGVMPPKSTDFYPKMLTGFVMYDTQGS